ncbi:hypothetical protein G6514_006331 [Epicoccum nigrum]|nr:hypothetical protein G6514_006331 [Epicoccum nigrum]
MTTPALDPPSTTAQDIPHATAPVSHTEPAYGALSSSAVEMETLPPAAGAPELSATTAATGDSGPPQTAPVVPAMDGTTTSSEATQPTAAPSAASPARNELNRTETEAALGPSTDGPAANPDNSNGPTVVIMLLLTTGARHPYKIDEKYLKKRNVTVEEMDPYNISVYTLKELIWRDWREDCRFQTEAPNVVHMTVKPQEVVDEEENAKTGKSSKTRDDGEEPTAGCRCVIL